MTSIPRAHPSQRKNSPDTPGRIRLPTDALSALSEVPGDEVTEVAAAS
ncbi:hypothetical protein [Mycolicibacterium alvei]|nr:hypothetical protein [Mycolicibacterium alvei]MCV7002186.1 hypothetical protein [Mycolicibacterium alvei]